MKSHFEETTMNELHKQIRNDAAKSIGDMVESLFLYAKDIVKDTGVTEDQLLKLALGGRTESIYKKAVSALAAKREKELLDLYQKKPELKAVGGKES